jgi:hypothetical protein
MIKFYIDTKYLRSAAIFASKDASRYIYYYLNGVKVEIFERHITLVSTDGHRLFVAHCELASDNFADQSMVGVNFILPSDAIKKALTGYKLDKISMGIKKNDLTLGLDTGLTPIYGTFPNWRELINPDKVNHSNELAQYDALYLADFAKASKILGNKRGYFDIGYNGDNAAPISFDDMNAAGLIMPVKPIGNSNYRAVFGQAFVGKENNAKNV